MMRPIFLVGMMGSGKSATARVLANHLGCASIDLDACIVEDQGKPISDIFANDGEAFFRDVESRVLREKTSRERVVVATGGGIIIRDENIAYMKEHGTIFYLESPIDELFARIAGDPARPLLKDPDPKGKLASLFAARKEQYEKADHCIDTTGRGIPEIVEMIVAILNKA